MSAKPISIGGKLAKAVRITDPLEMVGFLRTNGTNCQFVSLLTVTEPKLKKGCPYRDVVKFSRRNGLINVNYNTAVRRKISDAFGIPLSDVEYQNGTTWFVHQCTEDGKPLPIVVHAKKQTGEFYLQYFPLRSSGTRYVTNGGFGEEVKESDLERYFYSRTEREFKPATCVFNVANIKELRAARVIVKTQETELAQANLA